MASKLPDMTKFGDLVGLFTEVPDTEYHALKIPSNSGMKRYTELPALYQLEVLEKPADDEMSQALQMGKVFEILVLEPHRESLIVTFEAKGYDTKEANSVKAMNPGKIPISKADLANVKRWAACMLQKYPFNPDTLKQVSGIVDFDFGIRTVRTKFRLDEVDIENGLIFDYKLMRGVAPAEFEKDIWDRFYDTQAAIYCNAMQVLYPRPAEEPWRMKFRVQEKHDYGFDLRFTTAYWLDHESLERAWSHAKVQLELMGGDTTYNGYQEGCLTTQRFKWGR